MEQRSCRFAIGDAVSAIDPKDGRPYPAEVSRVLPTGYVLKWWWDLDETKVKETQVVERLQLPEHVTPRFDNDARVLATYDGAEDDEWHAGKISAVRRGTYDIAWDDGDSVTRVLESQVSPRVEARGARLDIDAPVLAWSAKWKAYYPAHVTAVLAAGYEVAWDDKMDPNEALQELQVQSLQRDRYSANPENVAFAQYCQNRAKRGELVPEVADAGLCPACRAVHLRDWVRDVSHGGRFYLCRPADASASLKVVRATEDGLAVLSLAQFAAQFHDAPRDKRTTWGLLAEVAAYAQLDFTPLIPPFVSLKIRARGKG